MNQSLLIAFAATVIAATHPAQAQTAPPSYNTPVPKMSAASSSLEERYRNCLEDPKCPVQERIRIMQDMHEEMRLTLGRMDQSCMRMNYGDCLSPQAMERRRWHDMHAQMGKMMKSMEPDDKALMEGFGSILGTKEPAAGDENAIPEKTGKEESKRWWRNLWDGKEEPTPKND